MKRIVSLLVILACVISLFACADTEQTTTETAEITAGTAEDDLIVTATEAQIAEWKALTDRRISEIESTPNMEIPEGATVYYVSNNGDDDNDGLSPETAWASLVMVNSNTVKEGCYVLFERGGLWRGAVTLHNGVTYSAYGEGEKPRIYSSLFNGADPELWEETEVPNVWKIKIGKDYDVVDVGFVLCDGNLGAKVIKWDNYDGTTVDRVSGYPFDTYADLRNDLQFVYAVEGKRDIGYIYMYSEGNPGERFDDIEFGVTVNIMYAVSLRDVTVDNIAFAYTGAHGFGIGSGTNITVKNCTFKWIGGGLQQGDDFTSKYVRYGNGIEIYGRCDGFYVDNNYLYQIYDTGITCQHGLRGEDACYMLNQRFRGNVIDYCNSPFEHFNYASDDENDPRYMSTVENYLIEGNITWHVGEGLSQQRPLWGGSNMAGNRYTRIKNFVIRDNLFAGSLSVIFGAVPQFENVDGSESLPVLIDNTFVHDRNKYFGRMTHDWLEWQAYDSTIPDSLAEGSSGNKFYAFPDTGDYIAPKEPDYEVVKFGKYEQDNNTENGKEDIEWYVLDRDGDYALLVSKYILDKWYYNEGLNSVTENPVVWEVYTTREWLNSTFIENAFTADEASKIRTTHVVMDENPDYPSNSGTDTDDKVFLLSYTEFMKYFPTAETRICKATKYAHEERKVVILSSSYAAEYSLRTVGIKQDKLVAVSAYGSVDTRGDISLNDTTAVRPAMWVKIK